MKNTTFSAVLFGALTLWQTLLTRYIIGSAALSQVPAFLAFETIVVLAFAAVAIWLMACEKQGISCGIKKAIVLGGVLYIAAVAMNFQGELMLAQSGMSTLGQNFSGMPFVIGTLVIKAVLLIAGIVFAVLPDKKEAAAVEESKEEETLTQETVAQADEAVVPETVPTQTEE